VVLRRQRDMVCYLFSNRQVKATKNIADYYTTLNDPDVWYLVDTVPDPGGVRAKTVFTCSPRRTVFKEFERYLLRITLYLPTWTCPEVDQLRVTIFNTMDMNKMYERFDLIGGIPRLIFSQTNLEEAVSAAINRSSFEKCTQMNGILEGSEDISHVLVHLEPDQDYTDPVVKFGSSYIKQKLVEFFSDRELQKLRSFLTTSPQLTFSGSLRGGLFEGWADQILIRGGTFQTRNLGKHINDVLTIPACHKVTVPKFIDNGQLCYFKPLDTDNFPCVDAWIPTIGFFQMTVSSTHPIKQRGIAQLLAQSPMRKFYFVIPDDDYLFNNFQWQSFIVPVPKKEPSKSKTKRWRAPDEDAGMYTDQLEEYVLKIHIS